MLDQILCCTNPEPSGHQQPCDEKAALLDEACQSTSAYSKVLPMKGPYRNTGQQRLTDEEEEASQAVSLLVQGDSTKLDELNRLVFKNRYHAASWAESIATGILNRLADALKSGSPLGDALRAAYEKAKELAVEAFHFAEEHPIFTLVIALGVLCQLAPGVIGVLGFARSGVVAGSWAARWQSTYGGYVEAGSLFSYLQKFGALYG